ncbi:MAG: NUDIX hydrolase [Parachlamydiales bacterium]|nr:NUDIX hydrolase [Parachlamydiales bacterium]
MRSIQQKEQEKSIENKLVYKGKIITLQLETFDVLGKSKTFEVIKHGGAVVILPIAADGRILLVQQWRRAVGEITIELPAGGLEKGEEPLACAKRELQEETGFAAKKIKPFGGFYSAPGFCDEFLHMFLAEDLYPSPLPPDDGEMIDLLPVTLNEAKHLITENRIRDAKTIAGILRYIVCGNG